VTELVRFMDERRDVGLAGSRLEDPDGTPQVSAFRFHSILSEFEHGVRLGPVSKALSKWRVAPPVPSEPGPADWVCGASLIVRREVFEKVGLLDERYFMYYEEVDFCLKAKRAGFACWYVPSSRVVHLVGSASGVSDARKHRKRRPAYWFESRRLYFVQNHGRVYALLADAAYATAFALWRVRRLVQRKPDTDPPRFLWDFVRHRALPSAPPRPRREHNRHGNPSRRAPRQRCRSRFARGPRHGPARPPPPPPRRNGSGSSRRSGRTGSRTAATGRAPASARSRFTASACGA
jgi:GT2 family glycosyltransferase